VSPPWDAASVEPNEALNHGGFAASPYQASGDFTPGRAGAEINAKVPK
jgi:hypothetical protein